METFETFGKAQTDARCALQRLFVNSFRTCSRFRGPGTASTDSHSQPLHNSLHSTTWSKEARWLRKRAMTTTLISAMKPKTTEGPQQVPTPIPTRRSKPCAQYSRRTRISVPCSSWIGLRISSPRPTSKMLKNGNNSRTSQRPLQNPMISK